MVLPLVVDLIAQIGLAYEGLGICSLMHGSTLAAGLCRCCPNLYHRRPQPEDYDPWDLMTTSTVRYHQLPLMMKDRLWYHFRLR